MAETDRAVVVPVTGFGAAAAGLVIVGPGRSQPGSARATLIEYAGKARLKLEPESDSAVVKLARADWPVLLSLCAVSWASPYCQNWACAAGWKPATANWPVIGPDGLLLITSRSRSPFAS